MAVFRFFVSRNFISVRWFDIESDSLKHARSIARKAARKVYPDTRAEATDNGWIPDEGHEVERIGSPHPLASMKPIFADKISTVYTPKGE